MKGLLKKVKLNARTAKIASTSMLMSIATATTCAFAGTTTTTKTTGTAEGLVQNLLGYVFAIFKYIGWLLLAWGVGQLVLAFKNEDADSKSRAMMLLVVAIILTSIGTIFNGLGVTDSVTTKDL